MSITVGMVAKSNKSSECLPPMAGWCIKLSLRLQQHFDKPGIYPATLIVNDDGTREIVLEGGKREWLGR